MKATMHDFSDTISHYLPGTVAGTIGGAFGGVRFVLLMIQWDHIWEAAIITVFCSFLGGVIGFFVQHFLKKLFPQKPK